MKGYASMSDQEIGRLVAAAMGMNGGASYNGATLVVRNGVWDIFDPCNNPADEWPILLENHIAIAPYKNATPCAWPSAEGLISKRVTKDVNPLRAGMITFLMMKEG